MIDNETVDYLILGAIYILREKSIIRLQISKHRYRYISNHFNRMNEISEQANRIYQSPFVNSLSSFSVSAEILFGIRLL